MCGIGGLARLDGAPVDAAILGAMSAAVAHRGPDGEGLEVPPAAPSVGLVHRRLAILDLSEAGRQPMPSADSGLWITYNGEVFNFRELRGELEAAGERFRSQSDTEVILKMYERHGIACLDRLRGMFALAILDTRRRELVLARDRLGIKPLIYHFGEDRLVFGSELDAVLADPTVPRDLDPVGLAGYLERGYIQAPHTAFQAIRKLPPGHYLRVPLDQRGRGDPPARYWRVRFEPEEVDDNAAAVRLLELLRETVALHLVSDVPVAAFLSGGMDSSAVVALAASAGPLRTFTVLFDGMDPEEARAARALALRYGTQHEEHRVGIDAARDLDLALGLMGDPLADPGILPTHHISRAARAAAKVCLSGDGGDEVFGGYDGYAQALRLDALGSMARPAARALAMAAPGLSRRPLVRRLGMSGCERLRDYGRLFEPEEVARLVGRRPEVENCDDGPRELLSRYQERDLRTYLPGNNLYRVDVASMRHGLEVRVPLLDHVLVEAMARIPARLKMPRPSRRKVLLRKALAGLLPPEVFSLRKRGFAPPLRRWVSRDLRDRIHDVLTASDTLDRNVVRAELAALSEAPGRRDHSARVWALLILESWLRRRAA